MQNIIIDEEFRCFLPELDEETYRLLEENIIEHGCRDALVLWNDILIDGYHRHKICTEHDVPFNTINKEFNSREEVLIWIVRNQISRRNLSPMQLSYFRGVHYLSDKIIQGTHNRFSDESKKRQNDVFYFSTSSRLAELYDISRRTIDRDGGLANALNAIGAQSPEAKRKILSGEVKINKKKLQELASGKDEDRRPEIEEIAAQIEDGTYNRRPPPPEPLPPAPQPPQTPSHAEISQLDEAVKRVTEGFRAGLSSLNTNNSLTKTKAAMRSALRAHIDKLEEIYIAI